MRSAGRVPGVEKVDKITYWSRTSRSERGNAFAKTTRSVKDGIITRSGGTRFRESYREVISSALLKPETASMPEMSNSVPRTVPSFETTGLLRGGLFRFVGRLFRGCRRASLVLGLLGWGSAVAPNEWDANEE